MPDDLRFEHRMSDMDALMWSIEKDPLLRSTITAVAVVDRSPDRDRLMDKLERGTHLIPRLRQRAMSAPFSVAPPAWVPDPNFDLRYHVRFVRATDDGSLRSLLDLATPIAMQGFDRARPLWEFTIVEGLADGRAALIQKVHHSVTDGVGGMKLALMLLDLEREPAPPTEPLPSAAGGVPAVSPWTLLRDGVAHERRRALGILKRSAARATALAADPVGITASAAAGAASLARLLAPAFDPLSPIMKDRSLSVAFDTIAVSLPDMKAAAKRADGRLNDAFVAAVAGGLRRYHERHDAPVDALRMSMPISIRSADSEGLAGNQFVPARFAVPLTPEDPVERMALMRRLVGEQRDEPALAATEAIAGVLNRLPTALTTQLFGS
ncbi:MAG TPA: wax ester/triacylglycerol synthase domain-containing protein, partial [Acidimicrobiales bacterium]|nr:wax ester/triacylglycerol synthase domain-containing protein [Acidimicrobiales bacterium]